MTLTLTPEPSASPSDPPRVRAHLVAPSGGTFSMLSLKRNGVPVRRAPFVGAAESVLFDYEAPFGVPLAYSAEGTYLPTTAPDWTETWANLTSWSGDTGSYSVGSSKASSSVAGAQIVRSAAGTIQRLDVLTPSYVRVELLDSSNAVVASVQVDSKVTVKGTSSTSVSGGGSFSASMVDGTMSVVAADSSWSVSRSYSGTPTKVRVVSLGISYPATLNFGTPGNPTAVALDSSGNVYVADYDNHLIHKFTSAGVEVTTGGFPISTPYPQALAVDSSGNIYVADYAGNTISKFSSSGIAGPSFSTSGTPLGVALDGSGNIYVADNDNNRIKKFTSSGVQVTIGGFPVNTTGAPEAVALDGSGNIYVADVDNDRIRKFTSAGATVSTGGFPITTSGIVVGLAIDSAGNIYTANYGAQVVRKFTSAGVEVSTGGFPIAGGRPQAIALDSSGGIYVADYYGSDVVKHVAVTPSVGAITETPATTPVPYFESGTTLLDETRAWLIHPSNPSLSVAVDINEWTDTGSNVAIDTAQQTDHAQPSSVFSPPGRVRSVVYPLGPRQVGKWTLGLNVADLSARDAILAMLADGAPLLLRAPDWDWDLPDDWYAVGDVTQTRIVQPLKQPYRHLTLPLTPVDSPPVALVPEFTFGDLLLITPTYADLLSDFASYLDVLTGSPL